MSIQRYTRVEVTDGQLVRYVPSGATLSAQGTQYTDIALANDAELEDLTAFIESIGGTFLQTAPTTPTAQAANPTGYARGCGTSYVSASQVSVAAGRVRAISDDFDILVPAVLTADITVAGANGLDAGVEAPSTWYAVYVLLDTTGVNPVASLLSASFAAPVLPAGYDKYRRMGCVRNDAGSDFAQFTDAEFLGANVPMLVVKYRQ